MISYNNLLILNLSYAWYSYLKKTLAKPYILVIPYFLLAILFAIYKSDEQEANLSLLLRKYNTQDFNRHSSSSCQGTSPHRHTRMRTHTETCMQCRQLRSSRNGSLKRVFGESFRRLVVPRAERLEVSRAERATLLSVSLCCCCALRRCRCRCCCCCCSVAYVTRRWQVVCVPVRERKILRDILNAFWRISISSSKRKQNKSIVLIHFIFCQCASNLKQLCVLLSMKLMMMLIMLMIMSDSVTC